MVTPCELSPRSDHARPNRRPTQPPSPFADRPAGHNHRGDPGLRHRRTAPRRRPPRRRPAALPAAVAARRRRSTVSPAPAAKGAERLGLHTVGDLLEHLPRDRQAARTIGELALEETATVVVEVRSITSRSVRRRGMKPLVEAVVADATGTMKATFFNQPWLERKYRPGTRLLLQGKYQGRNRFRVSFHAPTGEAVGASEGDMATYPATEGLSSTQILALAREWRGAALEALEPLPGAAARDRAAARPRRRARRRPLRRPRGRPPAARVRGAAAAPDRAAAPPRPPPRGRPRRAARAARAS